MRYGNLEGASMTHPSLKCKFSFPNSELVKSDLMMILSSPPSPPSHLKTLIPAFNECVDRMVKKLTPLADGVTVVLMKKEFAIVTLDAITQV